MDPFFQRFSASFRPQFGDLSKEARAAFGIGRFAGKIPETKPNGWSGRSRGLSYFVQWFERR